MSRKIITIIELLEIIGGFIGIVAIIIVIWDHFKDDRKLTKQVQEYYENIENFFASYIKKMKENSITNRSEYGFYSNVVKNNSPKYAKYLGITMGIDPSKSSHQENGYLTKTGYFLKEEGGLLKDGSHIIGNISELKASEIPAIDQFFTSLRDFWRAMYSKAIFRPKLKKKVEFAEFIFKK